MCECADNVSQLTTEVLGLCLMYIKKKLMRVNFLDLKFLVICYFQEANDYI